MLSSSYRLLQRLELCIYYFVNRAARFLGISSKYLGSPHGRYSTTSKYIADRRDSAEITIRIFRPAEVCRRRSPVHVSPGHSKTTASDTPVHYPETFALRLERGRVLLEDSFVISPHDMYLADLCDFGGRHDPQTGLPEALVPRLRFPKCRPVPSAIVLNKPGATNYYHWMTECIPRLCILDACFPEARRRAGAVITPPLSPFIVESLQCCGFWREKLMPADRTTHIEAETLYVPSLPGGVGNPPPWAIRFLRETFMGLRQKLGGQPTKLYVGRRGSTWRSVLNEDLLAAELARCGFTELRTGEMSIAEQVTAFANAQVIVAPHGAALTNLLWCSPGTLVVELFPASYVNMTNFSVAEAVGAEYRYIICENGDKSAGDGYPHDMSIDVPQLFDALQTLEAL